MECEKINTFFSTFFFEPFLKLLKTTLQTDHSECSLTEQQVHLVFNDIYRTLPLQAKKKFKVKAQHHILEEVPSSLIKPTNFGHSLIFHRPRYFRD